MKNSNDLKKGIHFLNKNGIQVKKITKLTEGILNSNYLINDKYVLKIVSSTNFYSLTKEKIILQNKLADLNFSSKYLFYDLDQKLFVSKFIPNLKSIDDNKLNYLQIEKIINTIKIFKNWKIDNLKELNYSKFLSSFRLRISPKDRLYFQKIENSKLLDLPKELSHFDLVKNNMLFDNEGNFYLLDFEFASYLPKYFDLSSLLSENEFSKSTEELIINTYFKDENESKEFYLTYKDEYFVILDLLWYHWAKYNASFKSEKEKIFNDIASLKKKDLFKRLNSLKFFEGFSTNIN